MRGEVFLSTVLPDLCQVETINTYIYYCSYSMYNMCACIYVMNFNLYI